MDRRLCILGTLVLSASAVLAQDTGPPSVIAIAREELKPGRIQDYVDYIKALNAGRDKIGSQAHTAVYQVASGATNGTFLTFTSMRSLSEMDDARQRMEQSQKALDEALGGADVVKQRRMLISDIVADGYNTVYAMEPTLSRPTEQFAAADPDFWNPKPAAAAKALASKKETPKAKEAPKP